MHITFIQTGGSIDKDYPRGKTHHGYEFVITDAAAKRVCEAFDFVFDYDVIEVLKKDSLDMTDDDCAAIVNAVREVSSDRIVITHGTDTIIQTGEALAAEITDKTIVLTGSALPEKFTNSDARFNIGMATGAAQGTTSWCIRSVVWACCAT